MMPVYQLVLLIITGVCGARGADYHEDYQNEDLKHVDEIPEVAGVEGAGADRGPAFYEYDTKESSIDEIGKSSDMSLSSKEEVHRSSASSLETAERIIRKRTYRECVPCPLDMIRKFTNLGIKWICGAYQRARRSFKSECMLRFRNCQDGTMFVKVSDRRCNDDAYHGRHWFYVYEV